MISINKYISESIVKDYEAIPENVILINSLKKKYVKRFIDLSKKIIVDKKKLSSTEQDEIKKLIQTRDVKLYIKQCKYQKGPLHILDYALTKLLTGLGLIGLGIGGASSILAISSVSALLVALSVGYWRTSSDRKKVKSELSKIIKVK